MRINQLVETGLLADMEFFLRYVPQYHLLTEKSTVRDWGILPIRNEPTTYRKKKRDLFCRSAASEHGPKNPKGKN